MTDEKIYELFEQREDKICERFEGNLKTLTEFIALENQGIKKSIDGLSEKVDRQNSSVKKLNEWKAKTEGKDEALQAVDKRSSDSLTKIIMLLGVMVSLGMGVFNSCAQNTIKQTLFWKADRMPDSTVRSATYPSITEDTAFINRLERSTKEILNK